MHDFTEKPEKTPSWNTVLVKSIFHSIHVLPYLGGSVGV